MRIKRFNENIDYDKYIKLIDYKEFNDLYNNQIKYDFTLLKEVLSEQAENIKNYYAWLEENIEVKNYFIYKYDSERVYLLFEIYAVDDDYFICKITNKYDSIYLKCDQEDSLSKISDFIIDKLSDS